MHSAAVPELTPAEAAERRRRVRKTALWLTAFAVLVYFGFIVAFINRHQ